jgi:L-seryl-tRNA(Ser) seleniumtransferase
MDDDSTGNLLRVIPPIDRILNDPLLASLRETYSEPVVKRLVRAAVDEVREEIREGKANKEACRTPAIIFRAGGIGMRRLAPKLMPVINATGVIVHTNLGRSPLSMRVIDRIAEIAMSYSNLEYNVEKGGRGERNSHLRQLMEELTGAEATLAVNNNAAAVLLALSTLAADSEVIVSRGELIEIGGSFRIPDVMARSGAILKEVGTTNRTHLRDYLEAITENTALILKVHTSNYRIVGFTREVSLDELATLGKDKGIPTMMDLGSGCLADLAPYGLPDETTVQEVVSKGIDVVSFSGDKLLGGPQAGILAGRADLIEKMRTNPLARALRMDKLTLAGLEATLEEYLRPEGPAKGIPTLNMIMRAPAQLEESAANLSTAIKERIGQEADVSVEPGIGRVGGGALPMSDLPGPRVAIRPRKISVARLEQNLRTGEPPVIGIIKDEALLLDPRTLLKDQAALIPNLIGAALKKQ